jgi:uncharacterized phage protein gp47/JayE
VAKTPDIVAKDILAKLAITAPGFSLELGTPERKIVDAVAEAISESSIDQYLVGSLLDIESKAGLELEQFCGIFGFGRLQGRKATGTVRVELNTANTQDINVPLGSQFYTRQSLPSSGSPLYFSSTQAVIIPAGSYIVDVPVECTVIGTTGNVPPDTIVYIGDILGATSVTNLQALTGGVDVETDDELRQRFKDTFLRSVIGTEDWYLGLCYQNRNVSKAACFGPIKKYATQLEIPEDVDDEPVNVSMDSLIAADIKYAWGGDQHVTVFKNLGQTDEVFFRRHDDYDWISGPTPQFARISGGTLLPGDVVDLEFEYTTRSSRNDPDLGIANKVDIYVNGTDPYTVTERTTLANITLTNVSTDQLYAGNFARVGTTGTPLHGHRFTRLGSTPVVSFPSIITLTSLVNGTPITANYTQGLDYHLIRSAPDINPNATTLLAGSQYEIAGIEWMPDGPAVGTSLSLSYIYNRVPELLQAVIKTSKQVTTDVLVHQAGYRYITVCLSVEYDRGFVVQQVNNAIQERLRSYFAGMPYGAWIEISDITLAVHQVLGVDNVKITKSTDPGAVVTSGNNTITENYGIKTYGDSTDLNMLTEHPYIDDFKLRDNQLPVFLEAIIRRTANR